MVHAQPHSYRISYRQLNGEFCLIFNILSLVDIFIVSFSSGFTFSRLATPFTVFLSNIYLARLGVGLIARTSNYASTHGLGSSHYYLQVIPLCLHYMANGSQTTPQHGIWN